MNFGSQKWIFRGIQTDHLGSPCNRVSSMNGNFVFLRKKLDFRNILDKKSWARVLSLSTSRSWESKPIFMECYPCRFLQKKSYKSTPECETFYEKRTWATVSNSKLMAEVWQESVRYLLSILCLKTLEKPLFSLSFGMLEARFTE